MEQIRFAANAAKSRKVMIEGDENAGAQAIGQIIGGINDIPSCQEVIERTIAEAEEILGTMKAKFIS